MSTYKFQQRATENIPEEIIVLCPPELIPILNDFMKLAIQYENGKNQRMITVEMLVAIYNGIRGGMYATTERITT